MKAIILAAGRGTRLGKYTENLPKCMLNFVGKTLIERQVEILRSKGIEDIIIVRGYSGNKIKIPNVKYYTNKDFKNTNMVESLFTAKRKLRGDILVCYGDIIYERRVIDNILNFKGDIGVVVDENYWDYWKARMQHPEIDIESLVLDSKGKISELGEGSCNLNKAKLRYVGLIKFSKRGIEILKEVYHKNRKKYFHTNNPWKRSESFKKAYMTCMLQALIDEGHDVWPIIINRGWMEFDTEEDYELSNEWIKKGTLKRFIKLEEGN